MRPSPRGHGKQALLLALLLLAPVSSAYADRPQEPRAEGAGRGRARQPLQLPADVAELKQLSVVLGRPTQHSVTLNLLAARASEVYVEYGLADQGPLHRSASIRLAAGVPQELLLDRLAANQAYVYRLHHRDTEASPATPFAKLASQHFHTQRAPGSSFSFQLQGDSHPERPHQFDAGLYAQTLRAAAADRPDFYLTLGDDFSVDTLPSWNRENVTQRYLLQRPFLALVGQTAPLFLVNGNHEQASRANLDGSPDNVAVWAQTARNKLFSLPAPDAFYSGNPEPVPHIGLLRDYYAWTWGDALFVVIDPYWHSEQAVDNELGKREKKGARDLWQISLGEAQYQWLRQTLEGSPARFKFVFAHHVLGTGRGGIEMAGLYEWGGRNKRGDDEFKARRPNWPLPIHALMAKTGVTIFFQGHDHVFARQQLDGVTYQTVPEPADPNGTLYFPEAFKSGDILPNSGRLKVLVGPDKVRVEYLRTAPSATEGVPSTLSPAFSYELSRQP